MSESKSRRGKTFIMLASMVTFGSSGDVLLSHGMKKLGELHSWALQALLCLFWSERLTAEPSGWGSHC